MPSLRKKTTVPQSSPNKGSSVSNTSQNDVETGSSGDASKLKTESMGLPDERPASPRRLRDRRLLAGFKPDTPSNDQQAIATPQKVDNNSHSTPTINQSPNNLQSARRLQPTTPSTANNTQQHGDNPRSLLKRPLGKAESLLAKKHPKPSGPSSSNTTTVSVAPPATSTPISKRTGVSSLKHTDADVGNLTDNNNLELTLDQLGAINMTKSTSRIKTFNVLIAVTGSVAAIKLIELIQKLRAAFPRSFTSMVDSQTYKATIAIKIVMTENSKHFIPKEEIFKNCGSSSARLAVLDDSDEWAQWNRLGDPVLHIELRKWADLCLIAPLDANTMAKLASGICDNLLTCTVRAWDTSKPLIYCPAMNVHMYSHPITGEHLNTLDSFGYQRVDCIEKRLACGDLGLGAMAEVNTIVDKVVESLLRPVSRANSILRLQQTSFPTGPTINNRGRSSSPLKGADTILQRLGMTSPIASGSPGATYANGSFSYQQCFKLTNNNRIPRENQDDLDQLMDEQIQNNRAANIVTSLQNLKAIDFDRMIRENSNDLDEPDSERRSNGYGYGPSSAIVQTLISKGIMGSPAPIDVVSQQRSSTSTSHRNSLGPSKLKGSLVDPSAFLSHCYNKSRNCFTCIICKNDYKNRKSMSRHLKEQHLQGNIHRCIPCGVSYKRREKLIKHNREHHNMVGPTI